MYHNHIYQSNYENDVKFYRKNTVSDSVAVGEFNDPNDEGDKDEGQHDIHAEFMGFPELLDDAFELFVRFEQIIVDFVYLLSQLDDLLI
jgi:hypothetical protein